MQLTDFQAGCIETGQLLAQQRIISGASHDSTAAMQRACVVIGVVEIKRV